MKKFVFSVLTLLTTSVFAQYISMGGQQIDGDTGNLVYTTVNPPPPGVDAFTWSGFTNTQSTGGGFSGGSSPAYNPTTGVFMFGYNRGTISYSTPLNYALASVGSNLNVNGFKYSWDYINQDYSKGTLTGNINVTNKSGQIVENRNYNMPATINGWTHMGGIENFATQYDATTLDRLNVSFSGKDDRWWAGYYGPQIKNISVSMLYSVLPPPVQTDFPSWLQLSNENGDFTLNKPGVVRYGANGVYVYHNFDAGTYSCSNSAWGVDPIGGVYKSCSLGSTTTSTPTVTVPKVTTVDTYSSGVALLEPTTTTVSDPVTTTTSVTPTTSSTIVDNTTPATTTTSAPQQQQSVVSAVVSAPAPVATTSSTSATTSSSSTSSSSQSSKEVSTSGSPSLALSIISKNSERDAAGSAVAQAAVAQAQQAATQAQQEAASVAQTAVSNSIASSQSSIRNESNGGASRSASGSSNGFEYSTQSASQLNAAISMMQTSTSTSQTSVDTQSILSIAMLSPVAIQTQQNTQAFTTIQSNTTVQSVEQKAQTTQSEQYVTSVPNPLTDKTNPLNDIFEGKQVIPQSNTIAPIGMSVNKNTSDNELAGGISISKMAYAPTGYSDYLNFTMKDASFYAPKEVYKNQQNVDNARALRQMTSDSKHREMVEAQYSK